MITINGRGWRGGSVKLTPTAAGLHIRVDDDHSPELWFEMQIETGLLVNMGNSAELLRDAPEFTTAPLGFNWGERVPAVRAIAPHDDVVARAAALIIYFRHIWIMASEQGTCDGVDGAEFTRVLDEWSQAGHPQNVADFIARRANAQADGSDGLV